MGYIQSMCQNCGGLLPPHVLGMPIAGVEKRETTDSVELLVRVACPHCDFNPIGYISTYTDKAFGNDQFERMSAAIKP